MWTRSKEQLLSLTLTVSTVSLMPTSSGDFFLHLLADLFILAWPRKWNFCLLCLGPSLLSLRLTRLYEHPWFFLSLHQESILQVCWAARDTEKATVKGFPNNATAWQTRSPLFLLALKRKHYNINWVFVKKTAASRHVSIYCPMSLPWACKSILGLLEEALGREVISQRWEERILSKEFDSDKFCGCGDIWECSFNLKHLIAASVLFWEGKKRCFLTGIFFRNCAWSKRECHSYQKGLCVLTEEASQSPSAVTTHDLCTRRISQHFSHKVTCAALSRTCSLQSICHPLQFLGRNFSHCSP